MVKKSDTIRSATNIENGDSNPNGIEKFIDFKAPRVTVYTTEEAKKHYPKVGTAVDLTPEKAEKWIEKGYATAEPVAAPPPAPKGKKNDVA